MAVVKAPRVRSRLTGPVAGVNFVGGVAETDDEAALAYFQRNGYTVEEGSLFDPSEHTVDQVVAYLDQEHVDWEEINRVVTVERAGKARKTILDWLPKD